MTRKDYEKIATAFARMRGLINEAGMFNPNIALDCIENELCAVMQSDNPRFDVDRFKSASHAQKEN